MGRIAPRTDPYSSPTRQQRHYKTKRDQILRQLCKASYINASHFAIIWTNSRGEVETFASELFQAKLGSWFPKDVVQDASATALSRRNARSKASRSSVVEKENVKEESEDGEGEDWNGADIVSHPVQHTQMNVVEDPPPLPLPLPAVGSMRAPVLRRTTSLPGPVEYSHVKERGRSVSFAPGTGGRAGGKRAREEEGPQEKRYRAIFVGDGAAMHIFFETRLRQLQQLVCKIVAKAWIKVVEPKKQTKYPYNRGELGRPAWWPAQARHKEPDHLMKPERLVLLMTMLRCGMARVSRLELATAEVGAAIPPDKWELLREIYRVAKEEEKLRDGLIGPASRVFLKEEPDLEQDTSLEQEQDALVKEELPQLPQQPQQEPDGFFDYPPFDMDQLPATPGQQRAQMYLVWQQNLQYHASLGALVPPQSLARHSHRWHALPPAEASSSPRLPTPLKRRPTDTPGSVAAVSFSEFLEQSPR